MTATDGLYVDVRHRNRSTALTYYPYLNKQTKQGNVWRIKNVKRVSVKPEKNIVKFFLNILETFHEIFHEIFQGKKNHEILHHCA